MPVNPDIVLSYQAGIPGEILDGFRDLVEADGLKLVFDERPAVRAYAGIEWLMPPLLAAYLAKPYFESFLTEAGKDHYKLVKEGIKLIARKVRAVSAKKIGTPGKVMPDNPYSMVFAVYFDRDGGGNFKFLVPDLVAEPELDVAMEAALKFIEDYRWKKLEDSLFEKVTTPSRTGQTVLLAYDPVAQSIKVVDPMESIMQPPKASHPVP